MAKDEIQQQITELNQKVDLLLEYVTDQRQKNQVFEDLADDVSRIGNDVVKSTIKDLDDYGLQIDMEEVKSLLFKFLRNIETFSDLLSTLQSVTDLAKDVSPLVKETIIDLTYELDKLEKAGVFDALKSIIKNLSNPEFLQKVARVTEIITTTPVDEKIDDKSIFKILKDLNSPEVRQTLSYAIRIVKEINK